MQHAHQPMPCTAQGTQPSSCELVLPHVIDGRKIMMTNNDDDGPIMMTGMPHVIDGRKMGGGETCCEWLELPVPQEQPCDDPPRSRASRRACMRRDEERPRATWERLAWRVGG